MKKITIIFMSVLMIFASCSMDTSYNDIIENAETVEKSKEDDTKNNTEEPSNEEPKEDNSENDNDEEGNSENTEIVEESKEDDTKNNTEEPSNEEPKEDNSENDNDGEGNSENTETVEDKTWCEISEDTKILGLNYFVCVDNSQKKLSPSINDEREAKKDTFLIRDYVSKYIEIRVGYNNKKLNFSSVSDSYIITDVMKKDSTINITIEWKNKQ